MAKQKAQQQPRELTALEKLGLRVSAMINSPKAQLDRQVTIHRMYTDPDEAWQAVLELLLEEDALEVTLNDDGTVTLRWALAGEGDQVVEEGELVAVEESPF
ncbi:DUF1654 domain-containing protein [Pseudomonas sp. BLCC-B13]|uniref:DUF1654 domain-containing protein n=1 Tax=Pseudomonas sp. BLCC-B13 TaxID=3025314 RepID=UPI00234F9E50|nr:DUF1654 domain-containing protein [Pseudomonas sp. BLCC-B13]MDC7825296.1 DUF1654 domain-containing protein [Pseudomonas sp. BLCC-B13]